MAFDCEKWLEEFVPKVQEAFGLRLRFVGLQGSYNRGEATDQSDIDLVVVLDTLSLQDLKKYRGLVRQMPHSNLACGFISGWEELSHWPAHELFHFCRDTRPILGSLDSISRRVTQQDIVTAARLGASGIYHSACHCFLYKKDARLYLEGLYKGVFHVLQAVHFCRTGVYAATQQELLPLLPWKDQQILQDCIHRHQLPKSGQAEVDALYQKLIEWAGELLHFQAFQRGRGD